MGTFIYTNVGIGDLFMLRLFLDGNKKLTHDLCISAKVIEYFRSKDKEYFQFLIYLLQILFNDRRVVFERNENFNKIPAEQFYRIMNFNIDQTNLKSYFSFINIPFDNEKYIVFQTKVRIDGIGICYENLQKLSTFMKTFKTKYKIYLLGEKKISETPEKNIHKIQSIYDYLLPLKTNNNVIDLVQDELILKPDVNIFERDLNLISHAHMNFGFGYGGNFSMTWSVSDNFCFFIDFLTHPIITFFEENKPEKLYRNFDTFLNKINEYK